MTAADYYLTLSVLDVVRKIINVICVCWRRISLVIHHYRKLFILRLNGPYLHYSSILRDINCKHPVIKGVLLNHSEI